MNPFAPMFIYRLFDRLGVLLYIGITDDILERMARHEREKIWWPDVDQTRTVIRPVVPRRKETPREAAIRVERLAIWAEHPRYNVQHNGRNPHRVVITQAPRRRSSPARTSRTRRRAEIRARRGSIARPVLWALAGGTALWCSPTYHWTAILAVALFVLALRSAARRRRYT